MKKDKPRVQFLIPNPVRRAVALSSGGKCHHCRKKAAQAILKNGVVRLFDSDGVAFEVDHLVPYRDGGKSTVENCVMSCRHCNRSKHRISDKELEESKDLIKIINKVV